MGVGCCEWLALPKHTGVPWQIAEDRAVNGLSHQGSANSLFNAADIAVLVAVGENLTDG
ncbi:hypothetical protein HGG75_10195 [Ochrobactrum pseudogrignonense]|nr:hypothetical protein [Brucella pseudogrignonensis]